MKSSYLTPDTFPHSKGSGKTAAQGKDKQILILKCSFPYFLELQHITYICTMLFSLYFFIHSFIHEDLIHSHRLIVLYYMSCTIIYSNIILSMGSQFFSSQLLSLQRMPHKTFFWEPIFVLLETCLRVNSQKRTWGIKE